MRSLGFAALLAGILLAGSAWGGQVEVKGEMLEGQIAGISKDGLIYTTEYGSGNIVIPWADLEEIRSDRQMIVVHGDDGVDSGSLLGVDGDTILVGTDAASAKRIPIASIYRGYDKADYDSSRLERLRARFRFWSASLAASGSITQAGTNSQSLQLDLDVARRKDNTRYLFDGIYRIADSEDEIDDEKDQIAKRVFTQLRAEHDITARGYLFGTQSFEWDKVEDLKARVIPRLGAGYRLIEQDWGFVAAELAPSFVYQRKRDDCSSCGPLGAAGRTSKGDNFWALSMGGRTEATLPYGSTFTASLDYFPNVEDWTAYLVRARGVFSLPILDWVSLRVSIENIYDSEAPDDTRQNRLIGALGLSLDF